MFLTVIHKGSAPQIPSSGTGRRGRLSSGPWASCCAKPAKYYHALLVALEDAVALDIATVVTAVDALVTSTLPFKLKLLNVFTMA